MSDSDYNPLPHLTRLTSTFALPSQTSVVQDCLWRSLRFLSHAIWNVFWVLLYDAKILYYEIISSLKLLKHFSSEFEGILISFKNIKSSMLHDLSHDSEVEFSSRLPDWLSSFTLKTVNLFRGIHIFVQMQSFHRLWTHFIFIYFLQYGVFNKKVMHPSAIPHAVQYLSTHRLLTWPKIFWVASINWEMALEVYNL